MRRRVEVLGCVLVLRAVATADVAAFQTQPQGHPRVAHLKAFFASVWSTRLDVLDVIEMRARLDHDKYLCSGRI